MRIIPIIALTLIGLFDLSCKEKVGNKGTENDTSYHEKLRLNDGEKWEANDATTIGIENMMVFLDEVNDTSFKSDIVVDKLDDEFKTIVAKCTMTGEAHDQLHYFILPLKDKIESLKNTTTKNRKGQLKEIKTYLKMYNTYFK